MFMLIVPAPLIVVEAKLHLAPVVLVMLIVVARSGARTIAVVPPALERLFQATEVPLKVTVLPFQVHWVVPERVKVPVCTQLLPQVSVAEPVLRVMINGTEQVQPLDDIVRVVPGVKDIVAEPDITILDDPSVTLPRTVRVVLKVSVPVYVVQVRFKQVRVPPVLIIQFALAASKTASSADVGTAPTEYVGEGVALQSPIVPQLEPVLLK